MSNHIDDDNDWPLYLYEYNDSGFHKGRVRISNDAELKATMATTVKIAIEEKREIRITDGGDYLVYHSRNGVVLWPSGLA